MKNMLISMLLLVVAGAFVSALADDSLPAKPAKADAPLPAKDENTTLATVGKMKITIKDLTEIMDRYEVPADARDYQRKQFFHALIEKQLICALLDKEKVTITEKTVKEMLAKQFGSENTIEWYMKTYKLTKKELFDEFRSLILDKQACSKENVDAYIKANPSYFKRDHISGMILLVECPFTAPTTQQLAALEMLQKTVKEIGTRKLSEETIKAKYPLIVVSTDDDITFDKYPMITPSTFDAPVDSFGKIVRIGGGFAVIKVTGRWSATQSLARKIIKASGTDPTEELVKKILQKFPEYVDGTEVSAQHILIKASTSATKQEKADATAKLAKIQAEIKAGKITFAGAAKKHSQCPSSAQGGDLGSFTFDSMVAPFAKVAFKTKAGQVSGIVETRFGFHLIKVVSRKTPEQLREKTEEEQKTARQKAASEALLAQLRIKLFSLPLLTCPIAVVD